MASILLSAVIITSFVNAASPFKIDTGRPGFVDRTYRSIHLNSGVNSHADIENIDAKQEIASAINKEATSLENDSVHLNLRSKPNTAINTQKADDEEEQQQALPENDNKKKTAVLHTYNDPKLSKKGQPLKGFNMSKRKFQAWVEQTLKTSPSATGALETTGAPFDPSCISSQDVFLDDNELRKELRALWRERQLLTERTEVLALYQSDIDRDTTSTSPGAHTHNHNDYQEQQRAKRGGFPDLLQLYADRLVSIIKDECQEEKIAIGELLVFNDTETGEQQPVPVEMLDILNGGLLGWMIREYGQKETDALCASHLLDLPEDEQFLVLQAFMDWFRDLFPYYYDRCNACGASAKDDSPDPTAVAKEDDNHHDNDKEDNEEDGNDDDDGTFLGYVYPSKLELLGKASRTEMYQCHKCRSFTRFPRYNSASVVIHNRRGRCGEYSMLLFRILRACGLQTRWVVDWADHVWAEIYLNERWIHLDPCEAAVDKPLLYEDWGKKQTYIVAFHAPPHKSNRSDKTAPLIEDVTARYTSDTMEQIQKHRRNDESTEDINVTMEQVSTILELSLMSVNIG